MELYLIRHADAVPLGQRGVRNDAERPLSEKGAAQAEALGRALRRHGVGLELVVTSPLLRARQTAEGILRGWSPPAPELLIHEGLVSGGTRGVPPGVARKKLTSFISETGRQGVAAVGHAPDLDLWAAWLVGSKNAQIVLAKAAVARITFDGKANKGTGTLVWLVTPEWLPGS